jgi:hypothetical protein
MRRSNLSGFNRESSKSVPKRTGGLRGISIGRLRRTSDVSGAVPGT